MKLESTKDAQKELVTYVIAIDIKTMKYVVKEIREFPLEKLMKKHGISYRQLGERVGVKHSQIHASVKPGIPLPEKTAKKIMDYFSDHVTDGRKCWCNPRVEKV